MKISELTGAALDEWCARAQGWTLSKSGATWLCSPPGTHRGRVMPKADYKPSSNWAQGGALLDSHDIVVERVRSKGSDDAYVARGNHPENITGPTYLIAAMRVLVASKYGDEVPD